ncbi:MAG TPA: regulatory protein RecX [Balneolaceae bacterium]
MADEAEPNLPAVISSISIQKKNKERYSLFVDDEFLLGVAEQTLLKFKLTKGVEVTPLLFRKLQQEEGRFAIKSYFLNLLSRRDHARKELLDKARRKDYPAEVIKNVLDELQKKGFINDTGFAEKYASEKYRLKKWGPVKIQSYLYKKGISKDVAHQSTEKVFKDENLNKTFLTLVLTRKKRFLKEDDPFKRKKKVFDYLARRGYPPSDIYKYLDELMQEIDQ